MVLIVIINYTNSKRNGFVYDDHSFVINNPYIRDIHNWDLYFTDSKNVQDPEGKFHIYRPLRTLLFSVEYKLFSLSASGYHFFSLILHIVNTLLVFWLIHLLVENDEESLLGSAIFAVHPVQAETVNWVSVQSDLLASLFGILALIYFVKGIHNRLLYILSVIMFIFALLSKEVSIIIPSVMALIVFLFIPSQLKIRNLYRIVPFIVLGLVYFVVRNKIIGQISQTIYWGGSIYTNFLAMLKVYIIYIYNILYPVNLSIEYDIKIPESIFNPIVLLSISILIIAARYILYNLRSKEIIFGILFCAIFLIPVSNIFPITALMADRFLYNSMIGIGIVFSFYINQIRVRYTKITLILFISIILSFVMLTIMRNIVWKNDMVLWAYTAKNMNENSKVLGNLAKSYAEKGMYDKTKKIYEKILAKKPNDLGALNGLGVCYYRLNEKKLAENIFLRSLELDSNNPFTLYNLAIIYLDRNDYNRARELLVKAIEKHPYYSEGYSALGIVYSGCGMLDKAEASFIKAIQIQPLKGEFYLNLKFFYKNNMLPDTMFRKYFNEFKKLAPDSVWIPKLE